MKVEVNTSTAVTWQGDVCFLGVRDHGMSDIVITRQPGRPCVSLEVREYAGQLKREEGK